MVLIPRICDVAALVFALCAGTSCDRKAASERAADITNTIEILIREGDAAKEKARYEEALAAYKKAQALAEKDKESGLGNIIIQRIAQTRWKMRRLPEQTPGEVKIKR